LFGHCGSVDLAEQVGEPTWGVEGGRIGQGHVQTASADGGGQAAAGDQRLQPGQVGGVLAGQGQLVMARKQPCCGSLEHPTSVLDHDQPIAHLLNFGEQV